MKILFLAFAGAALLAQSPRMDFLNHSQPILDAHNCYPYDGRWADRIDRALAGGLPVSIEVDLAWYVKPDSSEGRAVVAHNVKALTGAEPQPREYFFERVRPIVEKALKEGNSSQWPVLILHFDFKSDDAPLLRAAWSLLGEYEGWITTARKGADPHELAPFDRKPILVLTEDSDAQEELFFHQVPVGSKLRLFGSAHKPNIPGNNDAERARFSATLPPTELLSERPTNYRRWWNNPWGVVEDGGQPKAGQWTAADAARLRSLVEHAHRAGFVIRFFCLDGFTAIEDRGWDKIYNFGSRYAARIRWRAALEAGVDLLATDQYEDLAAEMRSVKAK